MGGIFDERFIEYIIKRIIDVFETHTKDQVHEPLKQIIDKMSQYALDKCNEEIDEFNKGFEAYKTGMSIDDEPYDTKYDQWKIGWVWAQHNGGKLKS